MPAVPSVTDLSDDRMKFRYVPKAKVVPTRAGIAKRRLQQTALALGTAMGSGTSALAQFSCHLGRRSADARNQPGIESWVVRKV
jgi:hypothetical protein